MVLGNGREVSMVKFSVEERSRIPLNACIVVHGNKEWIYDKTVSTAPLIYVPQLGSRFIIWKGSGGSYSKA